MWYSRCARPSQRLHRVSVPVSLISGASSLACRADRPVRRPEYAYDTCVCVDSLRGRSGRPRGPGGSAVPARYRPTTDPATGERYNVELAYGIWKPTPDLQVSGSSLGINGIVIDLVPDLGITKEKFREFRLVLRPAKKHKFRIGYTPIKYSVERQHPAPDHCLQRPEVQRRPAGDRGSGLEGVATRLRIRLRLARPRLLRRDPRSQVHARGLQPRQPGDHRVRVRQGANPGRRRHRPWLRRPQRRVDRRVHAVPPAEPRHGHLQRVLLRFRYVRHPQLHEQRRRAGGLSLAGRELHGEGRLRQHDPARRLLHGRGQVLPLASRLSSGAGG